MALLRSSLRIRALARNSINKLPAANCARFLAIGDGGKFPADFKALAPRKDGVTGVTEVTIIQKQQW